MYNVKKIQSYLILFNSASVANVSQIPSLMVTVKNDHMLHFNMDI